MGDTFGITGTFGDGLFGGDAAAASAGFPFHKDSGAWDRPDSGKDLFYDDPRGAVWQAPPQR